ncbi:MAG: cupin domain-containing protein [Candidatus Bathyarchaeia archaeon]|jgi:quercetin dioxygenase-like cupin family protein
MVQETHTKQNILIVNASAVPVEDFVKNGAEKVRVSYLIDERHGSDRFSLRLYTLEKGGHTPLDEHVHEHHVYVLSGRGLLRQSKETRPLRALKQGDTIFIPSMAVHQFSNESDEPFVFLCVKGNPTLYSSNVQAKVEDDSERNYC